MAARKALEEAVVKKRNRACMPEPPPPSGSVLRNPSPTIPSPPHLAHLAIATKGEVHGHQTFDKYPRGKKVFPF